MGGEGPYVRFANESLRLQGVSATPPPPLDDKQLDEAYARAHAFMLERVRQLVQLGWEQADANGAVDWRPLFSTRLADMDHTTDTLLASLSYTRVSNTHYGDGQSRVELRLPRTASAWFEPPFVPQWKSMFESWQLFNPWRRRGSDSKLDRHADAYLFVDVEAPLRDVFNFIQCLVPDKLVIIRINDIDDLGEEEITQRLPSSKWVEDHAIELSSIFGEERFENVARASQKYSCLSRMISSYMDDEYEDSEVLDFTACDKECGYCGRCDY